jgi:mono/diheme cytochrome c family protein
MPAWSQSAGGPLTDQQVGVLATGIKGRSWAKPSEANIDNSQSVYPSAPPLLPADADQSNENRKLVNSESLQAGRTVFARDCANCHGKDGRGGKFGDLNNQAFLALMSDLILRRYVITGRPDLGMPDFADSKGRDKSSFTPITAQEVNDIVALLASWRTPAPVEN